MVDMQVRLERLGERAMRELCAIGVPFKVPYKWEIKQGTSTWGTCNRKTNPITGEDYFTIKISKCTLDSRVSDEQALNVIIHELIHTVPGCFNHQSKFKEYAELVNDCYACYHIKRTESAAEMGYSVAELNEYKLRKTTRRYAIKCEKCGQVYKYTRITNCYKALQTGYKGYTCGVCHSNRLYILY